MLLSPRLRQGVQSLALALLMASITTAAVKVFGWKFWPRVVSAKHDPKRARSPSLVNDQRLVAVSSEPPPVSTPAASASALGVRRNLSATELFAAAKLAREKGD